MQQPVISTSILAVGVSASPATIHIPGDSATMQVGTGGAANGDTVLAPQWLETAVERGHQELWWARIDPSLDSIREALRFREIMNDRDSRIQALLE